VNDIQAILSCLQKNRSKISLECHTVLDNHGL
jgi:hypothetical protein